MNCMVTAGPTFEPLDEVRRLTNFSTGQLGTELAGYLTARGHRVTLLIGQLAIWPGPREAHAVEPFSTTADLRSKIEALARGRRPVDMIFHAAAVSDFTFGRIFTRRPDGSLAPVKASRKISTRAGALLAELVATPKIIAEMRGWYPAARIVGWKYEADAGRADALRAARKQIHDCRTDACVANGPAYGRGFALVTANGSRHFAGKAGLFAALETLA
jgi:phosphopantothenoylcysteine synthetase/decarboxylase